MNTRNWEIGVHVSEGMSDLRPILSEWCNLYSTASEAFPQTSEQYFLEQTLMGLLVTAAWRQGIPAILEVKSKRDGASNGVEGRMDALLDVKGGRTALEAKIDWFDNSERFESVLGNLEAACSQASTLDAALAKRRVGICFGVIEKGGKPIEELLKNALEQADANQLDFVAWAAENPSPESVRYPGCIAIGRMAP